MIEPIPEVRPAEKLFDYLATAGVKKEKLKKLEDEKMKKDLEKCTF